MLTCCYKQQVLFHKTTDMSGFTNYSSYLIRIWINKTWDGGKPREEWHGELECIQSGKSWKFERQDAFFSVFREQIENLRKSEQNLM